MGKRAISDLRISLFHLVQRHSGHETARGSNLQPIIIDSYLNMGILQITAFITALIIGSRILSGGSS